MGAGRSRIVIVGGGFGGLYAARALRRAPADVTLVDRRNFHLFQPLLYQVATGALSPANIAAPLRSILKRQRNTRVLLAEARGIDPARRTVRTDAGDLGYDVLVVATGASHAYFGHDAWERWAPGLKTVEDATEIRRRVLLAFERAEEAADATRRRAFLTFVIVGAGPTGAELAGALAEIARRTLRDDFRTIDPADARIVLVEAGPRVLPAYAGDLPERARAALSSLGVEVLAETTVIDVRDGAVDIEHEGRRETIAAATVLWAAGVAASPLGRALAEATGAEIDRAGRVRVAPDLTLPLHPEVFVIGDLMTLAGTDGKPLPGVAPVAMQQGRHVARTILARLAGRPAPGAFVYHDHGSMATIGRGRAVADLGFVRFSGTLAWLAWLFIHLMYLVQFGNRVLILVQWAWNYLTWNRSARLITERRP
ncbi:MAG TPA: NAD(P)/FAD-dependent oxidoreductase [Thermoanaerobaculia bacterium]|nr:NAD(P)/FAD-dependent oxidoreductase [Thermoanaerobaculia bacterium]